MSPLPNIALRAPAEHAFLTAIAVAEQQQARSFEMRAALSLAKLYQSINRAVDAHAVLAPALEGFSPTPEFPEVEEAQGLLAALAESDEVKNATASRQRRLKLQTSYGQAMMLSRGFASEETKVAFTRAHQLGKQIGDADERFDTHYGLYISQLLRGELASALETAEAFLREAESEGRPTEAAAANRLLGMAFLYRGALDNAQAHLSEALRLHDPERDRDAKFRFSADTGAAAASYLAQTKWYLGEINQAIELIEESGLRVMTLRPSRLSTTSEACSTCIVVMPRTRFVFRKPFSKSPKSVRWPSIAVKDWYTPVGPALGSATAKRVLRNLRE